MKKQHPSLPSWRPLVLWSILGISISYPLVYFLQTFTWRWTYMLHLVTWPRMWFLSPLSAFYFMVVLGIFVVFCLWWYRSRHPFFYVLVPLAALSCTAFSLYATMLLGASLQNPDSPLVRREIIWHLVLLFLCLWWWRTKNPVLYVWLPLTLLACSPFGMGAMLVLFH